MNIADGSRLSFNKKTHLAILNTSVMAIEYTSHTLEDVLIRLAANQIANFFTTRDRAREREYPRVCMLASDMKEMLKFGLTELAFGSRVKPEQKKLPLGLSQIFGLLAIL